MCLSYCWGSPDFAMTTRDTLESYRLGIKLEDLQQTFQDTIRVARELDVRYLWIDAFCIIQQEEDNADWNRECCRMSNIYRNSYLTVAATWAKSSQVGCFSVQEDDARIGPVKMRKTVHHDKNTSEADLSFPIHTRAWTYQELLLAPRILHYGRHEMLWECLEDHTCECGGAFQRRDEVSKSDFSNHISEFRSDNRHTPQSLWRKMVVQYSPLRLSRSGDKLPAFSGLAQEMQRQNKQEYLAGMWRDSLVADMSWYRSHLFNEKSEKLSQTPWRAPTWSWASVDGPVEYAQELYVTYRRAMSIEQHAKVLSVKCSPKTPSLNADSDSHTGDIKDGFVELDCSLIPASFTETRARIRVGSLLRYWYPDGRYQMDEPEEFYVIPMVTTDYTFNGLVVTRKSQHSDEMIRVGLVSFYKPPHLWTLEIHSHKKQSVKII